MQICYQGQKLTEYLADLGLELSVVKRPRKWFWCTPGQEPPFVPSFTKLPKRWIYDAYLCMAW